MLRKMGWSDGEGLGKSGEGVRDPIGLENTQIDKAGVGGSQNQRLPPIDYGDNYRESIRRAARVRYEQLERK